MVDWAKKITKAVGGDLDPGEQIEAGLFVQQGGSMAAGIGMQAGIGGLVATQKSTAKKLEAAEIDPTVGIAGGIPKKNLVLGLTGKRLIVWGHSRMTGKAKGLEASIPRENIVGMELAPGKINQKLTIVFDDGSGLFLDAPKVGKPDNFLAAFEGSAG